MTSVCFSPNGKFVLAWTLDSCVRLWNYIEGRAAKTYQGHVNQKYSLSGAFGVYGKDAFKKQDEEMRDQDDPEAAATEEAKWPFVVSGSEDGTILLWDVGTKDVLQQLRGHEGAVLCVDTHPTERRMVSAGMDKTVRVWVCDEDGEEFQEVTEDAEAFEGAAAVPPGDVQMVDSDADAGAAG